MSTNQQAWLRILQHQLSLVGVIRRQILPPERILEIMENLLMIQIPPHRKINSMQRVVKIVKRKVLQKPPKILQMQQM